MLNIVSICTETQKSEEPFMSVLKQVKHIKNLYYKLKKLTKIPNNA